MGLEKVDGLFVAGQFRRQTVRLRLGGSEPERDHYKQR